MINSEDLFGYLKKLDKKLKWRIRMIAVGGTAMVLENLKDSTMDIDFCVETERDYNMLMKAKSSIKSDFKMDLWHSGYIFSLQLPDDYITRARAIKMNFKSIILKVLSPLDIIITKTSRLSQRDIEDIEAVIKKKKIDKRKLIERFNIVKESWPSSDKLLKDNFKSVLKEFFD